jgi:hypothetical protein
VVQRFGEIVSRWAPLEIAIGGKDIGAQVVELPVAAIAHRVSLAPKKECLFAQTILTLVLDSAELLHEEPFGPLFPKKLHATGDC